MKRLLIMICFLVILVGCEKEKQRDPAFLEVGDVSSYTDTTYYMDLNLDVETIKLYVSGDIVYVNETLETNELYINLYANSDNRFGNRNNVENLVVTIDGTEYNPETLGDYDTSYRFLLDEDLVIGENVHIEFEYEFVYWNHDRLVYSEDYFVSMFFYPFVAVFDDTGWNIDEYTFYGESYYNTIGDYYVTINTPTDYLVASSGKLLDTRDLEEERTETDYFLDDGRDFSFSASNQYVVL